MPAFPPTRDMLSNVKTSLTLDETAQVVLDFVVSNRGDDIFTIVMTVAGMPAYVNAITFLTVSTQWCFTHSTGVVWNGYTI